MHQTQHIGVNPAIAIGEKCGGRERLESFVAECQHKLDDAQEKLRQWQQDQPKKRRKPQDDPFRVTIDRLQVCMDIAKHVLQTKKLTLADAIEQFDQVKRHVVSFCFNLVRRAAYPELQA